MTGWTRSTRERQLAEEYFVSRTALREALRLLNTLPHLLHCGLRIPADLSLIYPSSDPAVERLSRLPDRCDLGDRLSHRLANAAQARLAGDHPASSVLLPRLVKGETLG